MSCRDPAWPVLSSGDVRVTGGSTKVGTVEPGDDAFRCRRICRQRMIEALGSAFGLCPCSVQRRLRIRQVKTFGALSVVIRRWCCRRRQILELLHHSTSSSMLACRFHEWSSVLRIAHRFVFGERCVRCACASVEPTKRVCVGFALS